MGVLLMMGGGAVIIGKNILLIYFMFQAIWNSLEGSYFFVEKLIILVEWGNPPYPPWKIPPK